MCCERVWVDRFGLLQSGVWQSPNCPQRSGESSSVACSSGRVGPGLMVQLAYTKHSAQQTREELVKSKKKLGWAGDVPPSSKDTTVEFTSRCVPPCLSLDLIASRELTIQTAREGAVSPVAREKWTQRECVGAHRLGGSVDRGRETRVEGQPRLYTDKLTKSHHVSSAFRRPCSREGRDFYLARLHVQIQTS
jgi:hypothetical protein